MSRDPRHGRNLPSGSRMARVMTGILRAMQRHALAVLRRGRVPDFEAYQRVIADALLPLYIAEYRRGERQAPRVSRRRRAYAGVVTKAPDPMTGFAWDIFRPEVPDAVRALVLALAGEVTQSTRRDIRAAILRGLEDGRPVSEIADDLRTHFSPQRAWTIAQTEASRAMHVGEIDSMRREERDTGLRFDKVWLASSDACKTCEKLNGMRVGIDEPFMVWPTGNPAYRIVMAPPAHPNCFCAVTWEEVE